RGMRGARPRPAVGIGPRVGTVEGDALDLNALALLPFREVTGADPDRAVGEFHHRLHAGIPFQLVAQIDEVVEHILDVAFDRCAALDDGHVPSRQNHPYCTASLVVTTSLLV